MSRAAFALDTDVAKSSTGKSGGVRVSKPGDTHEVEADRVADTVLGGGSVPGWSLASKGFDGIQRMPVESHGDAATQVEHLLLASAEGRAAIAKVTAGAAAGTLVTGSTAAAVVAALTAGHKGMAMGGSISLDRIHAGLTVKVARGAGVGGAAVSLSYVPKSTAQHMQPERHANAAKTESPAKATEKKPEPQQLAVHDAAKRDELKVHRKAERSEAAYTGSAEVDSVVRSPGRQMEPATRREMESKIGFDFGSVRLHTDTRAADSARGLSAQAYTVGSNVVFAPGRYAPQTTEGRHLLAHELTHVVQQTGGAGPSRSAGLHVSKPAPGVVQRASWRDILAIGGLGEKVKGLSGYHLFSVIIGKDLIDDKDVERNASTLTEGVLELFPGGKDLFSLLKRGASAIQSGYRWLEARLSDLHLDKVSLLSLLDKAWAAVSYTDFKGSWERVSALLREPIDHLLVLKAEIFEKLKNLILTAVFEAFPAGKKIWPILQKAGATLSRVAADPISFAKNLFAAVQQGFQRFKEKIWTNLLQGLQTFVFEEIGIPGLEAPPDYKPQTLFKLALEVLGLTYEHRREQLVTKLEPLGGEVALHYFEKFNNAFQKVREGGLTAIWSMIKDKLHSVADSIFDAIRNWAIEKIITTGMAKIAALSNPIGDAVEIIRGIYEIIEFFLEKAAKMIEFVESIVDSFARIVDGDVGGAAAMIEATIKKSIPLILKFMANLFGFDGFGAAIRKVIQTMKDKVDQAIGRVIDYLVELALPAWKAVKDTYTAQMDAIKNWWLKPAKFNYGNEQHELQVEEVDGKTEVYVHSDRSRLSVFLDDHQATAKQKQEALRLAKGLNWKEGKLVSLSKSEASYDNFVSLTKLMDTLKAKFPQKSRVDDRNQTHSTYGSGVKAQAFLSSQLLSGSKPGGKDPVAWTDLGYLLPPNPPYFVRGHLISEKLGGRGEWTNLMPITNTANGEMERIVERPLKDALADPANGNYYHYSVEANYGPQPSIPANATAKSRADQAAKRLVSLSWTVRKAVNNNGAWEGTTEAPLRRNGAKDDPMDAKVQNGKVDALMGA